MYNMTNKYSLSSQSLTHTHTHIPEESHSCRYPLCFWKIRQVAPNPAGVNAAAPTELGSPPAEV